MPAGIRCLRVREVFSGVVSEPPHPQAEEHDHQQHRADARPVDPVQNRKKMQQRHQLGVKKSADLSRKIVDAALGWGASVGSG